MMASFEIALICQKLLHLMHVIETVHSTVIYERSLTPSYITQQYEFQHQVLLGCMSESSSDLLTAAKHHSPTHAKTYPPAPEPLVHKLCMPRRHVQTQARLSFRSPFQQRSEREQPARYSMDRR